MSRAKKPTKAKKRRQPAQDDQHAQRQRASDERIANLSCGYAAADDFAGMCGVRAEEAGWDCDAADAAERLWRRAARQGHPLTAACADLHAELDRHRAAMLDLERRFDALMEAVPHDHVQPDAEDTRRIRAAILGTTDPTPPEVQPPA